MEKDLSRDKMWHAKQHFMLCDRMHRMMVENNIRDLGIHRSQHAVLMYLCRADKAPTQKEVAQEFRISPAAVAATAKKLEKNGYISREVQQKDNRYNQITVTPKGKIMMQKTRALFDGIDETMFTGFSAEELDTLISYFERIEKNFNENGIVVPCSGERKEN